MASLLRKKRRETWGFGQQKMEKKQTQGLLSIRITILICFFNDD
jgi:hypothetical protein